MTNKKLKQVYYIKHDNGDLGWLYTSPNGKIRHTSNRRKLGGNIIQEALRGQPDNIKVTILIEVLPDNKEVKPDEQ